MKPFSVQRLGVILAAILGLGVIFAAQPASAAVPGATFSVDRRTAAPGDRLTLTMSLTNTEDSEIYFAYMSVQPTWPAIAQPGDFTITGCAGDTDNCTANGNSAYFAFRAPIAPGATRTTTITVRIASHSFGSDPVVLNWAPYVYCEYDLTANSRLTKDQFWGYGLPELQTVITG